MDLKQLIAGIEKDIGLFSKSYKTADNGHVFDIPFELKPAEQFLAALGGSKNPHARLSIASPTLQITGNPETKITSFAPKKNPGQLIIAGARTDRLLASPKIYVNTNIFPAGLYKKAMDEELVSKNILPEEANGIHWENLAVGGLCHVQEVDFLVGSKISEHGRAHTIALDGRIEKDDPAVLLLSSPRLNLSGELANHLDAATQIKFIEGMYRNLFDATLSEGRKYLVMPAAGLGSHGGKPSMYFAALMNVAKDFPKLNIIYHPDDHEKEFDMALEKAKLDNVVRATKNILFIANALTQRGVPCAVHNPSDSDVMYGLLDVGGPWKSNKEEQHASSIFNRLLGNKKNQTSQTYIGTITTAALNSYGMNPKAYSNIMERNLISAHELEASTSKSSLEVHHSTEDLANNRADEQQPERTSETTNHSQPAHTTEDTTHAQPDPVTADTNHSQPAPAPADTNHTQPAPAAADTNHSQPAPEAADTNHSQPAPEAADTDHSQAAPATADTDHSQAQPAQSPPKKETKNAPASKASAPGNSGIFKPAKKPKKQVPQPQPTTSSLNEEQLRAINHTIDRLITERQFFWYPNKDVKKIKIDALSELMRKAETMSVHEAIAAIKVEYPRVAEGRFSTRTADLLHQLEQQATGNSLAL